MFSATPRFSGIGLHPASLPGRFGAGEIGPEAYRWLECLERMGQRVWVLPPVADWSGPAGDVLLLSFDSLRNDGVMLPGDLALLPAFNDHRIEREPVREVRAAFLKLAARRFLQQVELSPLLQHAFEKFCDAEAWWLDDWALYQALRHAHDERSWNEWPRDLARRDEASIAEAIVQFEPEIEEHKVLQFLFARQWQRLRARAHDLGIQLIGTQAFHAQRDSAEVWAAQQLFVQKESSGPLRYQWSTQRAAVQEWWQARWQQSLRWFDALTIDNASTAPDTEEWLALRDGLDAATFVAAQGPEASLFWAGASWAEMESAWQTSYPIAAVGFADLLVGSASFDLPTWRFLWDEVTPELQLRLRTLTAKTRRL